MTETEALHKLKYLESSLSFHAGVDNYMAFPGHSQIRNSEQERTLTRRSQSPHVLTLPNSADNNSAVLQQAHLGSWYAAESDHSIHYLHTEDTGNTLKALQSLIECKSSWALGTLHQEAFPSRPCTIGMWKENASRARGRIGSKSAISQITLMSRHYVEYKARVQQPACAVQ